MYQRTKRRVLTFLSIAFTATLGLLCATSMPNAYSTKAELSAPTNLKADALGYLRWDEVSDATGYEWSYSTDGIEYSTGGTCGGTEADVSAAITEAVEAAQEGKKTSAMLKLKVRALPDGAASDPIDFASNTMDEKYRKSIFDKYINLGYSTHDISERYSPAATTGGVTGVNSFSANSAIYMNELMTFSLTFSKASAYYRTGFLSDGTTGWADLYYGLTINQTGKVTTLRKNANSWGFDHFPAMSVGATSYFAIGAFDTYSVVDGSWIGETLYLSRTDIVDGSPVVVGTLSVFYDARLTATSSYNFHLPSDRPAHLPDARNHTAISNRADNVTLEDGTTARAGTVPKDTFYMYTDDKGAILKQGKQPATLGVEKPTMAHYDNVTGQVQWNQVDDATAYEWSYAGSNVWTETKENYIPADKVAEAIQLAKTNKANSVRFAVKAVNANSESQTEYVGLDLTAFYGKATALKDISDIHTELQNPSATLAGGNTYIHNGYAVNTFVENTFEFNNITNWQRRFAASMLASGDGQWNGYDVTIHAQGFVTISTGLQWQLTTKNIYWQRAQVAFEIGKKYIATYGVEELFNQQKEKVADRITIKISELEANGYRKLLTIISYDNYEFNWEGVKRPTLNAEGTYTTQQINYQITSVENSTDYCKVSCANLERNIKYVVANGVSHSNPATYTAGETLSFEAPTVPTGYVFEGWYLDADYNQPIESTEGLYNDLTVYAKLKQVYAVTVIDKDNKEKTEYVDGVFTLPTYSASGVIGYDVNGALCQAGDTIEVSGNITVKEVYLKFKVLGAQARLDYTGQYYGGLRFVMQVDSETITKYANSIKGIKIFGLLAPTDEIVGELDGVGEELTQSASGVYYMTLTNILYTNYNRAFSVRGYAEITYADDETVKVYTTDTKSRSIYEVACSATGSATETDKAKEVLKNYLGYTVNVVKTGETYALATTEDGLPTGVTRMYEIAEDGLTLTLREIPQKLLDVLADSPYVPVSVWNEDGTYTRALVKVTVNGTTATASLADLMFKNN